MPVSSVLTLFKSLLFLDGATIVSTHFAQREHRSTTTRGCEEESIDARAGNRSGDEENEEEEELELEDSDDVDVLKAGVCEDRVEFECDDEERAYAAWA